jgi:hypothetical protein
MMLRRLLEEIERGPARTVGELSRALGVDRELVCAMVDHLVRMGRLHETQQVRGAGSAACAGCPVAGRCQIGGPPGGGPVGPQLPSV